MTQKFLNRHQRRAHAKLNPGTENSAHKVVYETAYAFALEMYAEMARKGLVKDFSDATARLWASENWPLFRMEARATLAKMLSGNLAENLKDAIYQGLILDAQIPRREGIAQLKRDF